MPEYNKDLGVYMVGLALLEFVSEYKRDLANFTGAGGRRTVPQIAFKTEARRFQAGLKDLTKNSASPKAASLEAAAKSVLDDIISYQTVDGNREAQLRNLVTAMRPQNGNVFKTLPGQVVPIDGK